MAIPLKVISDRIRENPKLIIADDFEIAVESDRLSRQIFRNGNQVSEAREEGTWVSLRILHRKAVGRAATHDTSTESLVSLVEKAFEMAKLSAGDPWFRFPIWKQISPETPSFQKVANPTTQIPKGILLCEEVLDSFDKETFLSRKTEKSTLMGHQRWSELRTTVAAEKDLRVISEERNFLVLENSAPVAPNLFDRVLSPATKGTISAPFFLLGSAAATTLIEMVAPWFCADKVRRRLSPLGTLKGGTFFSRSLNLTDWGNLEGLPTARSFDLEGSPCKKTPVVEAGEWTGRLFDVYEGARDNQLSTGNYLRARGSPWPSILPSIFYVQPSERSVSDLLKDMHQGYWIDAFEKATLDSTNKLQALGNGRQVERGALQNPVRGITFEVDILALLRRAIGVANDLQFCRNFGSPSILFEKLPT